MFSSLRHPGRYRAGLVDPPWRFEGYTAKSTGVPQRAPGQHYPTMTEGELCALPVGDLFGPDAALFMWIIDSHVPQGIKVAEAWGFKWSTGPVFVWDKKHIGMGKWARKQGEFVYLFTRGSPGRRVGGGGVRQFIREPRREHSRKPDRIRTDIERLVVGPYLELFGRNEPNDLWDVAGNEVGKFRSRKI